jgi:Uma2 family endonuclease
MTVDEYLRYSSKPNCEYIDGVLRPKALPTKPHAETQFVSITLLRLQGVEALGEITLRMSSTRFLVPDLIADPIIENPYPTRPVTLCVEILSPGDRFSEALAKCQDYHAWGVPYCWVIDPVKQTAWEYHAKCDLAKVQLGGTLDAGNLLVHMDDLFSRQPL